MSEIPPHFQVPTAPVAAAQAVVQLEQARFSLLTSRLIRLEFSPDGRFEDRASQVFWHRQQPAPSFTTRQERGWLYVETTHLQLAYRPGRPFAPETLHITLNESGRRWRYGDEDPANLQGTFRTLDMADGPVPLEQGLLSRQGWSLVDDTASLVFLENGWLAPRAAAPAYRDLYFFGYGLAFQDCLRDFVKVAGSVPLVPRWALGNWWSRYWAYTQAELLDLMRAFRRHRVPLSVCILDMDWHLTVVDTTLQQWPWTTTGWTGYTWNRELFPDPPALLTALREMGLKSGLNLHPADGVWPHEAAYPAMAQRMGLDPATGEPVRFDLANARFAVAYFQELHHPLEADGVDFWWMDWQQGEESSLPGLDPLWWLNHLHFLDAGRAGRRPFLFSRWGGLGNHRYPIGFSGDTHVTWQSLAFQPYFTATAANVNYGWWSHDIGGHMQGVEDAELYARWVQFGVFSPILRLHSTNNPFHERRPWGYDPNTLAVVREAMQLRHALIPLLYTLSWQNHREGTPPIRPMYHDYPEIEDAYHCPQQYLFGADLVVAPFCTPADAETGHSRQVVWLPPGAWFHFGDGAHFAGNRWHACYGRLADTPVFARAGAIVPLGPRQDWGGVEPPDQLELHLFAGADGAFTLFEDDGETQAYRDGAYAETTIQQTWREDRLTATVLPPVGAASHLLPAPRTLRFVIHGVGAPEDVRLTVADGPHAVRFSYDLATETARSSEVTLPAGAGCRLTLRAAPSRRDRTIEKCRQMLAHFRLETQTKREIAVQLPSLTREPARWHQFRLQMPAATLRAMLELTQQAGMVVFPHPRQVVLWNNWQRPSVTFATTHFDGSQFSGSARYQAASGRAPRAWFWQPSRAWRVQLSYDAVLTVQSAGDE